MSGGDTYKMACLWARKRPGLASAAVHHSYQIPSLEVILIFLKVESQDLRIPSPKRLELPTHLHTLGNYLPSPTKILIILGPHLGSQLRTPFRHFNTPSAD